MGQKSRFLVVGTPSRGQSAKNIFVKYSKQVFNYIQILIVTTNCVSKTTNLFIFRNNTVKVNRRILMQPCAFIFTIIDARNSKIRAFTYKYRLLMIFFSSCCACKSSFTKMKISYLFLNTFKINNFVCSVE